MFLKKNTPAPDHALIHTTQINYFHLILHESTCLSNSAIHIFKEREQKYDKVFQKSRNRVESK